MATFTVLRVEEKPDRDNNMECFVSVQYINPETGVAIPYAKWLSDEEYAQYLADETLLESILIPSWEVIALANYQASLQAQSTEAVPMVNARLVMLRNGILDTVESAIGSMTGDEGRAAQIQWEYSINLHRNSILCKQLSAQLGYTEKQLDDWFAEAATLNLLG